ncbi:MAG: LacI family DNA-binding transcriptional regulator [Victivallaceae bacterium]|nr:LacI family DNA-binding transcriptional regulator [Victivallaceae bacterium]
MAKKTTVRDIAERLGISPATVSFVLNNRNQGISETTRHKVIETATRMNYRKIPRTDMLGWLRIAYLTHQIQYFNFNTSFFAEVYNHLQRQASQAKIELSLHEFNPEGSTEEKYLQLQQLQAMDMDVYICNSTKIAEYFTRHGLKVILGQGGLNPECVNVFCDDYTAGKVAAEHALKMGHRRAGMLFPHQVNSPRFNGFKENFIAGGGSCPAEFQWRPPYNHAEAEQFVRAQSRHKALPSLFYCFADNFMFPAIRGFAANGLDIPGDVSLIGTDNLYWGRFARPAFTTVDLCEELFADQLIEAIKHTVAGKPPYQLAVPVRLVSRETVRRLN